MIPKFNLSSEEKEKTGLFFVAFNPNEFILPSLMVHLFRVTFKIHLNLKLKKI
jgi:hypothetical protein